jgi:hypothetical protein
METRQKVGSRVHFLFYRFSRRFFRREVGLLLHRLSSCGILECRFASLFRAFFFGSSEDWSCGWFRWQFLVYIPPVRIVYPTPHNIIRVTYLSV